MRCQYYEGLGLTVKYAPVNWVLLSTLFYRQGKQRLGVFTAGNKNTPPLFSKTDSSEFNRFPAPPLKRSPSPGKIQAASCLLQWPQHLGWWGA